MCDIFRDYFGYQMTPDAINACHPLYKTGRNIPIIVKFVYFADKDAIYLRKSRLAGQTNYYGETLIVHERLTPTNKAVVQKCRDLSLIFSTWNCRVKVFGRRHDGSFYSKSVKSTKDVDEFSADAVKKQRNHFQQQNRNPYQKPPLPPLRPRNKNVGFSLCPPTPADKRERQESPVDFESQDFAPNSQKQHPNKKFNLCMSPEAVANDAETVTNTSAVT